MTDNLDIFISHTEKDAEWTCTWLLPQLEARGLSVRSANDLLAGGARIEQIAQEADRSKHTLLVLSPDWVANQWEIFTGLIARSADPVGRQRKTIPLLRERCEPPRSIARLVSADFTSEQPSDWEKEFSRLLAVLNGQRSRTTLGPPLGALIGAEAPTNFKFPQNRHFVGRDQELAELHDLLDDAVPLGVNAARTTSTVAGLTGLGGVGKTQLVVEYIHRYGKSYPGGIFWINAADGVEDDFVEIGRIISGNGHEKKPDELIRISFDYLRSDPDTLLVVDNLNETALLNQPVAGILTPISLPCRLLFTTRRRDLRGLRSIAVDMLTEADALKLLLRSRPAILERNHPDHTVAVQLCATLGGLPLAIEMAAAYLEQEEDVTLSGYLKRLGKEGSLKTLDTLEQAKEWSQTWHDPIQITLQSQWDTLTNAEPRLLLQAAALMPEAAAIPLARLSLLTGLNPIAEEGYPAPLASALRRLHNYSLIEKLEGDQVRLHPLVREFVRTQITDIDGFSLLCASNMATALENMLRVNKEIFERGVDELIYDIRLGLKFDPQLKTLEDLQRVLDRESHNLRKDYYKSVPGYILQQIRKGALAANHKTLLVRSEHSLGMIGVPWIKERASRESESVTMLRTLEGHEDSISSICITPDRRHVLSVTGRNGMRLWDLETGRCLNIFGSASAGVVSPDRKQVISAGGSSLTIWDIETAKVLRTLDVPFKLSEMYEVERQDPYYRDPSITCLAITSDGKQVITGSEDQTLRLLDLESGSVLHVLNETYSVKNVILTPDGKFAVSYNENRSSSIVLLLWDIQSGQLLHTFEGHTGYINHASFLPDGRHMLSSASDKTMRLWEIETGQCVRVFEFDDPPVDRFSILPDGERVLLVRWNSLELYDLEIGKRLFVLQRHRIPIGNVNVTPDGRYAVSSLHDELHVWDLEGFQNQENSADHANADNTNGPYPNETNILSESKSVDSHPVLEIGSNPGELFLNSIEINLNQEYTRRIRSSSNEVQSSGVFELLQHLSQYKGGRDKASVDLALNGKYALFHQAGRRLCLWDLESGSYRNVLSAIFFTDAEKRPGLISTPDYPPPITYLIEHMAVSPDGRYVFSGASGNTLYQWDIATGQQIHIFSGHTEPINEVAVTPDSKMAISASSDRTMRLWDLQSGQCLKVLVGHTDSVDHVKVSPNGKSVVSTSADQTIRLWDLESGNCQNIYEHLPEGRVDELMFTQEGQLVAFTSKWGSFSLWDVEKKKKLQSCGGETGSFSSIRSVPGRDYALAAGWAGNIRLWDIKNGEHSKAFIGHTSYSKYLVALAVSSNGEFAVSANNTEMCVWGLRNGDLLHTFDGVGSIENIVITPDGRQVVSESFDVVTYLWDLDNKKCLRVFDKSPRPDDLLISPNEKYALLKYIDHTEVWNLESRLLVSTLPGFPSLKQIAISADSKYAVSAVGTELNLWELASGKCLLTLEETGSAFTGVTFSPDGKYAVASGKYIYLWDLVTGLLSAVFCS